MEVTFTDIEKYLDEVKTAINAGKYRVEMNDKRRDNQDLFIDYVVDEEKRKQILLSLTTTDFSAILPNEHVGFEHELLYVFGKAVNLLPRFGTGEEEVPLYIKFNKRTCLLTQASPCMKVNCSALRAPAIAASIRNPACRPTCSYWLARQMSVCPCVPARSPYSRLPGLSK